LQGNCTFLISQARGDLTPRQSFGFATPVHMFGIISPTRDVRLRKARQYNDLSEALARELTVPTAFRHWQAGNVG